MSHLANSRMTPNTSFLLDAQSVADSRDASNAHNAIPYSSYVYDGIHRRLIYDRNSYK